jgi:5-hydroxyisourate hydrolase
VSQDRPTVSTHVLDTAAGTPRVGVHVRLRRLDAGGDAPLVGEGVTDADGRIRDLLGGAALQAGAYRLEFTLGPGGFFDGVALDIRIVDTARSYHVPLLMAPFGLTTYRGS